MYDPLNRLTQADYSTGDYYHYTYDKVGNRETQVKSVGGQVTTDSYVYDDANRLSSVNGTLYTWDDNGNLLADGVNTYTYDSANRMVSFSNVTASMSYTYNGLGDRLSQTVDGITTSYTLDLDAGLTQVLADGTNTYLYGNGRIAQVGAATEYFLGDALGSVRQMADAAGEITLQKSYDPYGNVMQSAGSGASAFAFTGEQQDSSELVHLRARYYSPYLKQFIQSDTYNSDPYQPADRNKFTYGRDNPINNTDPTGKVSLHFLVLIRFASRYNLHPEYSITSTIPKTPPAWPGQRRGRRVDLADLALRQIWEVEPFSPTGWYPPGHGPAQLATYLDLLNEQDPYPWFPGRFLPEENFAVGLFDVRAWTLSPGFIVFEPKLNKGRTIGTLIITCLTQIDRYLQWREKWFPGPGKLPPFPELPPLEPYPGLNPVAPPGIVPPLIPVPIAF